MFKTVLGIDPGKRNGWWCLFKVGNVGNLRLARSAHIDMNPDATVMERIAHLYYEAKRILNITRPTYLIAERFVTRPRGGRGNVSEPVNHLLALLYHECKSRHIIPYFVMPSVHKVWRRKTYGSDEEFFVKWSKQGLNEHQLDACSIAHYGWENRIWNE